LEQQWRDRAWEWVFRPPRLAERHAAVAVETGLYKEKEFRSRGERLKSQQRVAFAKAGYKGTPMEVLEDTATELEKDALMIRRESKLESQEWESRAAIERAKKESVRRAGRYKVASTLLTGGMGAFGSYGKYKGWEGF
jgi:hypothetical protein